MNSKKLLYPVWLFVWMKSLYLRLIINQLKLKQMGYKYLLLFCLFFIAIFFGCKCTSSQEKNWTHFRGSNLNAIAETEKIPLKWDDSAIKWKTEIHDMGYSSPVVYGNQIWVTTAKSDGKELYAVCIDFQTGKIIHDLKVFTNDVVERKNSINTYASPTPCIEKGFVYVHYGNLGTACINSETGSIVWKSTEFQCKNVHGPGSSPIIYKNLLILHYEGSDVRYIVALDKSDGKLVWRSDRPSEPYEPLSPVGKLAYITPIIINVKGQDMLISNGSAICQAFDPGTGKEIWRIVYGAETTISMPFTENGVLFWLTGFMVGADGVNYAYLLAVNPDGKGDIKESNIIWKKEDKPAENQMLSPVIKDGLIYTVTAMNIMMCVDAVTGKELWSKHVTTNYNSSPLYINGNVWFFSVKGDVLVLKAGREYEEVARNQMDSGIWATPAVLRNSMIIRTQKYLYRIG
jgi:outer membrane protein assembly factor BamB